MTADDPLRVRCQRCDEFYDADDGHLCSSAAVEAAMLPPAVDDPAVVDAGVLADVDRPHPLGLTWRSPRSVFGPILLGPSEDHPDLHLGLDLAADRFFRAARHGLDVGRARIDVEEAALWYAHAPNMRDATNRLAYLAHTTSVLSERVTSYASELVSVSASSRETAL